MAKRNHIESAMRYHKLVYFVMACLLLFGVLALPRMNKDEFPQVTIRLGVVVGVYPGATAEEVEEQVAKPIEQYLFSFKEIDKKKTYSISKDGIVYVFAALSPKVMNADEAWAKIRGGIGLFKQTKLPGGLAAVAVIDDFGNTSSMLLTLESNSRSPRELEALADQLADYLRDIPEMGSIKMLGQQREEIAVTLDMERMSKYAINQNMIMARIATQGFRTITGEVANEEGAALIHVEVPYNSEYDLGQQIIYSDPVTGQTVRLRDIATIERRYKKESSYIETFDENGRRSCFMLNLEMQPGNNIVAFGDKIDDVLRHAEAVFPPDVTIHKVTDQPRVVNSSVRSFLKDLVISVLIVILVMLVLFPLRTALVSSTGLPVCIAITIGIMYLLGIELNTVTLAALIVVLGMVVDDSVIVIDGYSDLLAQGHSRWYAAAVSTTELFVPMLIATTSISGMFFPMLGLMTGAMADFIKLFPWTIFIALTCSICYAVWVIPYMSTVMIRPRPKNKQPSLFERVQASFFNALQNGYQWLLDKCFRHPWLTLGTAMATVLLGAFIGTRLDTSMMPKADRDCFAVEIHLTEGSSLMETQAVADSLAAILTQDNRVVNLTAFVGLSGPRFHATYAPQMAGDNYAQFIVNTTSPEATVSLIRDYQPRTENMFPNAFCRYKQLDYMAVANPIELHVQGSDLASMERTADSLKAYLATLPELTWVHGSDDETLTTIVLRLHDDEANRLGVTQATLSMYLNGAINGRRITSLWDGDYKTPVTLYTQGVDSMAYADIGNTMIPTALPGVWVPVRQVAEVIPDFHHAQIKRRNSIRTITVAADTRGTVSAMKMYFIIKRHIDKYIEPTLPESVAIRYGGAAANTFEMLPGLIASVAAALLVLFVLLLYHFKGISISVLSLSTSLLCLFGATFGLWMFGLDISVTGILGIISLIGIIVRNAIIMYEYAEHLRVKEHMSAREAAYLAGQRRMRPIFLTTATTALGVVPMIIAATALWMPMGVVICFGAIITMPMVVTVLPVAYWKLYAKESPEPSTEAKFPTSQTMQPSQTAKVKPALALAVLVVVLCSLFFVPQNTQAQEVLTLDSALNAARQRNCTIQTAVRDVAISQEVKKQVLWKYFPQVSLTSFGFYGIKPIVDIYIPNIFSDLETRELLVEFFDEMKKEDPTTPDHLTSLQYGISAGATAIQPVYWGGQIVTGNKLAKLGIQATEKKVEMTERDVLQEVEESYLLVVGLLNKRQIINEVNALLDTISRVAQVAYQSGLVTQNDLIKVELKKNETATQSLRLENGIQLAMRNLCNLISVEYTKDMQLEQLSDEEGIALVAPMDTFSVEGRPEAELLQMNVQAANLRRRMAIGEALPKVAIGLQGGYGYYLEEGRWNGIGFFTVQIPLTQWGETSHKIREHNLRLQSAQALQDDLMAKMRLQNEQAYDALTENIQLIVQHKSAIRMAEDNYRLALLNYRAGITTISDLLESQALLLQAQTAYTDARINYRTALRKFNDLNK